MLKISSNKVAIYFLKSNLKVFSEVLIIYKLSFN